MTIQEAQKDIVSEFEFLTDWEDKYAHIIKMGRELPDLPEEYRIDRYKVDGCQSQVWINAKLEEDKINIYADSDAMIVKGLIAMLVRVYSGHKPDEILNAPPEFLQEIGIDNHLSPTRKNGLSAMLKQIKMYALAYKSVLNKQQAN